MKNEGWKKLMQQASSEPVSAVAVFPSSPSL